MSVEHWLFKWSLITENTEFGYCNNDVFEQKENAIVKKMLFKLGNYKYKAKQQ